MFPFTFRSILSGILLILPEQLKSDMTAAKDMEKPVSSARLDIMQSISKDTECIIIIK